jgi:ferredoxin
MNEDGLAEVYDPAGAPEENIQEAIDACPVACIHWED